MSRRAALILTPRLPWPQDDGGRIVMWQSVAAAAREWDVTLVSLYDPRAPEAREPSELRAWGVRVTRVAHHPPSTAASAWAGLAGPWPYTLARYRSAACDAAVRETVARDRPAFALVHNLHMATYADALGGTPLVLREQNVEHRWMARYARSLGARPAALYARLQAARLRRAEAVLCGRAALVLAIQPEETQALRALEPRARVETLPIGVDPGRFNAPEPVEPPVVLLAGSFEWPPNEAGAIAFLRGGWPRVAARAPRARLRLAGKSPSDRLRSAAAAAGAEAAGYVPSMAEEFRRAAVLVVPLWVGAGARVKIVEGMAAGLPVVATPLGAEGLGLVAGREYVAAETPAALGDAVAELLESPERRAALACAARETAAARFSLEAIARLQNDLCASIAR